MLSGVVKLEDLLNKYLIAHSSRRINYLYWNYTGMKDNVLCFVNLYGNDLTRINNGELVFRAVRVKDQEDWLKLKEFFDTYIVDKTQPKAVYVIRVDFLMSYLKKIRFNLDDIKFTRNDFGTLMSGVITDVKDVKPLCTIDTDIQSLILIDTVFNKNRRLMFSDNPDWEIADILDEYLTNDDFRFKINKLSMVVIDGLDIVPRKFIRATVEKDPKTKLEQIFIKNGITSIVSRLNGDNVSIITTRVHLQYFLKEYQRAKCPPPK